MSSRVIPYQSAGVFLILILTMWSCSKKDEEPVAPNITFKSISASQVTEFQNAIRVIITYEDLQGDIGEPDPDTYSLRIKDDRLQGYDWYHIPPMTPDLMSLHIRGEYEVTLAPLFLLGNGSSETTRFTIQLRDRAGNWSNRIQTPSVTIIQ